jgi:hypothetical protein
LKAASNSLPGELAGKVSAVVVDWIALVVDWIAGVVWLALSRAAGALTSEAVTLAKRMTVPTDTTANTTAVAAKTKTAFLTTPDDAALLALDCSAASAGPDRKRGMGSFGENRSFTIG